ncbi:MAG TPA: ScpA family protein [Alphaproteobacteria bacterium]|nr:segregation/condensation protein A [Alphaproteobacteria bacterium]USO05802.1 MAG: segregation/condensation protein A [Rhodospirillales bacterium]HOO82193.1 ScpA family protein [Alphaproteobacteria bacterium]
MNDIAIQNSEFQEDPPRAEKVSEADALLLNIDGYEGPIDVLLELARNQKVDLLQVSILQLVRQYLSFMERAKELNLDLAAEYLVMAAWLAYLKSRLLLPRENNEVDPSAEEMAEALQFQLRRLEAMQNAADRLIGQPQLGQQVFARGAPEGVRVHTTTRWDVKLYDLLKAYGDIKKRIEGQSYDLPTFNLMSMENAMSRLSRMLGQLPRKGMHSVWSTLESFMPEGVRSKLFGRSALASTFTAGLELVKQGKLEIKQDGLFRPIYMRGVIAGDKA